MAKNMAPMHRNQMSRHSHDVSQGYTTTLACGQLRPVYFDILGPGDSVYYKTKAFARLQEVVTAFLGEVDIHLDYFFVPLQMLYTPFGQIFAQTNDMISDHFVGTERFSIDMFPTFNIKDFVDYRNNRFKSLQWTYECFGMATARMLDDFDLNPYAVCDAYQQQNAVGDMPSEAIPYALTHSPNITPWIPCAYQAIFNRFFRNDDVERLDVPSYNFDSAFEDGVIPAARNILTLRYSQRPSDYFTDVKISPLYSAVNQFASQADGSPDVSGGQKLTNVLQKVNQWLVGSNTFTDSDQDTIFGLGNSSHNFAGGDGYIDSDLNTNNRMSYGGSVYDTMTSYSNASAIRTLFAVDKFLRVYGRAGKTYDDQILAHFGFEVPHDVKHDITHLGHNRFVITSEPVYSSSATPDGSLLGQVGGQGSAGIETDGDKFTAPVHGVFMCIVHAVTKPRYQNTFSKLHLLSDRLSFPIPEFDKLGMQPMYAYEAQPIFFDEEIDSSVRIGWQYRYEQFKRKYNRVSLAYNTALPASQGADDQSMSMQGVGSNAFNPWVLSREAFNYSDTFDGNQPDELNFSSYNQLHRLVLCERPDALNNIMVVQYDGTWKNDYFKYPHLMFQQDPLIFDFKCECKKVSWMSETGEPDL